jgi:hypothetical protein
MVRPKFMNIIQQYTVAENIVNVDIGSHPGFVDQI